MHHATPVEGKTRLPKSWSDKEFDAAAQLVANYPEVTVRRGDRLIRRGMVKGVLFQVDSYYDSIVGRLSFHAYPVRGVGVERFTNGAWRPAPLDLGV